MKKYLLLLCLSILLPGISVASNAGDINTRIIDLKTSIQNATAEQNTDSLRSELGSLYLHTGQYVSAEKELKKLNFPSALDFTNLARVYLFIFDSTKFSELVALPDFASNLDKTTYSAFKAQSELFAGNDNTAYSILKSIKEKTDLSRLIEAKVLLQKEEYQNSLKSLQQVDSEEYPESFLVKSDIYKNTGYLLLAMEALNSYSKLHTESTYHLPRLLQLQLVSEDFSSSKKTIGKILKLQPKNTFALQSDAIIALQEKDYAKAYARMEKIFSYISVPTEQQIYLMATSSLKTKRYETAVRYIERLDDLSTDAYNIKEIIEVIESKAFYEKSSDTAASSKDIATVIKLYKVALLSLSDGDTERAKEIATSMVNNNPELPHGYYINSLISIQNNDLSNAYNSSVTTFNLSPYNPININNMVYLAERTDQVNNTVELIDKKLSEAKENDPVITLLVYRYRLDKSSSIEKLEKYYNDSKDQNAALQLSLIYRERGTIEDAYALLTDLYKASNKNNFDLRDSFVIEYSNVLKLLNKIDEADSFFNDLLQKHYRSEKFIKAAMAFHLAYKKDSFDQFLSKWSKALPSNPLLLRAKIQKLLDNKDFVAANTLFDENEEMILSASSGKITAGVIYNQKKEYEKSAGYFYEEYKVNPSETLLLTTYRAFLIAKDQNKAHAMLRDGIQKYPNNRYIKALYAQSLIKRNKDLAINVYLGLLENDSTSLVYLNNIADLYNSQGDQESARKYINKALSLHPGNEALIKTQQKIENSIN